jgi:glycosyltransferase involved in cell wall biosynthesis
MRVLGLSPKRIFSGFEVSFFDAVEGCGVAVAREPVEAPLFKLASTIASVRPSRTAWGHKRDRLYHTTITAFRLKSAAARRIVKRYEADVDAIYQVGALWNPLDAACRVPLILQVDYTSVLSQRRGSGWKRQKGREQNFWVDAEHRLYDSAAVILATTENARASLINDYGVSPDHVVTVGAGVSAPYDRLDPHRRPAYDSRRVLFVGKGIEGKGLDTVIDAFAKVRLRVPGARLTVAGPMTSPGVHEGVDFLGRVDPARVRELYYEHAVFAMPSRFEPLGQVFLEAMACGLPCIGTTLDAMPELIHDGRTGFLIEPGDADALADHLCALLLDPSLSARLGHAGVEKLATHHTWPVVGAKIVGEMERVLGSISARETAPRRVSVSNGRG